ncbi:hypothetical protein SUDANB58_02941 [Streptomyces sp. enrichment culture]
MISLLVGYVPRALDPRQAFARTMITIGWVFGAVAAVAILAAAGPLVTALRNRPCTETGPYREMSRAVTEARDAWHDAPVERGILPFSCATPAPIRTRRVRRHVRHRPCRPAVCRSSATTGPVSPAPAAVRLWGPSGRGGASGLHEPGPHRSGPRRAGPPAGMADGAGTGPPQWSAGVTWSGRTCRADVAEDGGAG